MMRIAIQGIEGSFHDQAARAYGGASVEPVSCERFQDVVDAVTTGRADQGILAIENTIAGTLPGNYALIRDSGLHVTGEVVARIRHHLMACESVPMSEIREVRSHPMALLQCEEYLQTLSGIRRVETWDGAASARALAESPDPRVAVIAPRQAAESYGLTILASGIESNKRNFTRFLVLSPNANMHGNKATLCMTIPHRVGSLAKVLDVLAQCEMNLTKIQSTPIIGKEWEYWMFLDVEFSESHVFDAAMEAIRPMTTVTKILGLYQKGKVIS